LQSAESFCLYDVQWSSGRVSDLHRSSASNLEQVANLCVLRPTQPPTLSETGNEQ